MTDGPDAAPVTGVPSLFAGLQMADGFSPAPLAGGGGCEPASNRVRGRHE